ncbi:MAG: signal peptide peptidase SppA [Actinobacteria bacterium]|nr:signal peptide peptidase SppA [Actinomycetota bacterium]
MNEKRSKMSAGKITGFVFLGLFIIIILSSGCFIGGFFTGSLGSSLTGATAGFSSGLESIYLIRIEGVISGGASSSLLGGSTVTPEAVIEQLRAAQANPSVKAILLRVNSGGGSAAASQEIFEELKKVSKPVVVSVGDVCASGAYYIACAADSIVANRTSSVGSIGVILQVTNLEELYKKLGIQYTTIKQGKYKDAGSSSRPMTAEEKELLKEQTFKIYEQFINDVAQSRNIPVEKVKEIATGWVFLGTEALELGLIDSIGTYRDAESIAAQLGGIKGRPNIIGRQQLNIFDLFLNYSMGKIAESMLDFIESQPQQQSQFLY